MIGMRRLALTLALILAAAGWLFAQTAVPTTAEQAPRIQADELNKLVEKGQAVLVDVRSREAFEGSHAEGALHIPLAELSARLKELPKDKLVAAYCT